MARKIEFDRDQALGQSMMLFLQKGYENTSMQDLVDTLKVNRFSIYNTFGDKKTLFLLSIKHYRQQVFDSQNTPLMDSELDAMESLDSYISLFGHNLQSSSGQFGCLIQNCSMSDVRNDTDINKFISDTLENLESSLVKVLKRAEDQGQLMPDCKPEIAALYIMSCLQGLILLRKFGKDAKSIDQQITYLKKTVRSWKRAIN